jgi:hypothetical protein
MDATSVPRSRRRPGALALAIGMSLSLLLPAATSADENQPPIGHHDANEGAVNGNDCVASGWAVDPDDLGARLSVRVSLDGTVVATATADEFRSDLADLGISDGFSGWSVDLLGIAVTDAAHTVLAEAQDAQTGGWFVLESSQKSLTCGNATPIGFHDGNEGSVPSYECAAFGWTVDRDDLSARLQVRIVVDGTEVVSGVADALREDLIASGDSPDGLAGFVFDLRDLVSPAVTHQVVAQARDNETHEWFDLEATPRSLRCADDPATNPFIGAWTSPDSFDGSTETFTVSGGPGPQAVVYRDDFGSICVDHEAPTTRFVAHGSARLFAADIIEITLDEGRCGPVSLPIGFAFQLVYLEGTDVLTDGERTWTRVGGSSGAGAMAWHRLNPFDTKTGEPEHERFTCVETDGWRCRYDKLPENALGLSWDSTKGSFEGADGGSCPVHLLGDVCESVTLVVEGTTTFRPWTGPAFSEPQQLLFTSGEGGLAPLYVHWVDGDFACPWHATWEAALGADPACFLP